MTKANHYEKFVIFSSEKQEEDRRNGKDGQIEEFDIIPI
jgi:hypothetical protein